MNLKLPATNLHEKSVAFIARQVSKLITLLILCRIPGAGRSYVLRQVARALSAGAPGNLTVIPLLSKERTRTALAKQLHYSLTDTHTAMHDLSLPYAGNGSVEEQAKTIIQELRKRHFIMVADDINEFSKEALELLADLKRLPNVGLVMACGKTKKEAVRQFLLKVRPETFFLPSPTDRELAGFLDELLEANQLPRERFKPFLSVLVKASHGAPGKLVEAVERLALTGEDAEGFRLRVLEFLRESKVYLHLESVRLLLAIAGMSAALILRITTSTIFAGVTAVVIGAVSLALYRVLLGHGRQDADLIGAP